VKKKFFWGQELKNAFNDTFLETRREKRTEGETSPRFFEPRLSPSLELFAYEFGTEYT